VSADVSGHRDIPVGAQLVRLGQSGATCSSMGFDDELQRKRGNPGHEQFLLAAG
jgi:hypothetical protein